ncbi:hypothetical protein EYC84_003227 [Monilinia fructicola]|uniref:FAD-binding FR-type domain-containing protein n=1 Tax=Monilinia fructicola TaxID=38448 RepID=A0A5M9JVB5_MONFR|nr:hypothetical protein EYC84_003227 [Monilinia fructicola]
MSNNKFLSDEEINQFLDDLDSNSNGYIEYDEVEHKLDEVHRELAPEPEPHNLHHADRQDDERHLFLRSVIGSDKDQIPREEFANTVRGWEVPSLKPSQKAGENHDEYMRSMSWGRKFRAVWSVRGPDIIFLLIVITLQAGFGVWQLTKYLGKTEYRHAFGWGMVMAKTCAGVLYPTLFFQIISMSRWISTLARKSYRISRFINWDLSQSFHIMISIVALFFSTVHSIGHLTGTFLYGSRPSQQEYVEEVLGKEMSYRDYIATLPGWTGLTALGLFWTLAALSMPVVRKRSYEIFQLGHLLMYPIVALLLVHGTAALLQEPMLGYWLIGPITLVFVERTSRILIAFWRFPARLQVLDASTVNISVTVPQQRHWSYKAGQYIFLCVPEISFFQWHPFTISTCVGNEMQLHIKTDGNWTTQLRKLVTDGEYENISICIDGPYGAPAQRFYDFDHSLIIGSGIGVTPFSGILADLKAREESCPVPPTSSYTENSVMYSEKTVRERRQPYRVDFHWIVADKNYLLWFSNLLNSISSSLSSHEEGKNPGTDIHIITHVTQKKKSISTHVFRYLLEIHRTDAHPESPLTGLINPTRFGRPDLAAIMDGHYEEMLRFYGTAERGRSRDGGKSKDAKRRVGVFFCGAPVIGYELADRCQLLTLRGREDRSLIEYHFMMEVFG